jgi:hypothetical protein
MMMKQSTAIFEDEQGQAVRIPDEVKFDSKEVFIFEDWIEDPPPDPSVK